MSRSNLVTPSTQPVKDMLSMECVRMYTITVSRHLVNDTLSMQCVRTNPLIVFEQPIAYECIKVYFQFLLENTSFSIELI